MQRHRAEISNRKSGAMSGRKSGGNIRAGGALTRRVLTPSLRSSIRMLGVALCLLSVGPSPSWAQGAVTLAYVVSPPPATREVMPRYLPQLPPEATARIRQVAPPGARRVRAGRWYGYLRPRHLRRCTHCRHRVRKLGTSRRCRHAGHCSTHRHGRSGQHRWVPLSATGEPPTASTGKSVIAPRLPQRSELCSHRHAPNLAGTLGSTNDLRWLSARSVTACSLIAPLVESVRQSERLRIETLTNKVDMPINAWSRGNFQAAICNVTPRRETRLLVLRFTAVPQ